MAYQADKPIALAHGHKLRNGQIIGSAPTIATKSTKQKSLGAPVHSGMAHKQDGVVVRGASKTSTGSDMTPRGQTKCGTCAPVKPGMTRDRSKPIC